MKPTITLLLLLGSASFVRAAENITTDKSTYSSGDTAALQISLTNTSDELIVLAPFAPPDLVHLLVNRYGKPFHPNITPLGSGAVVMPLGRMKPHETWKPTGDKVQEVTAHHGTSCRSLVGTPSR